MMVDGPDGHWVLRCVIDNVTYYDKVSLRMSFIGYQAPNVGHIL